MGRSRIGTLATRTLLAGVLLAALGTLPTGAAGAGGLVASAGAAQALGDVIPAPVSVQAAATPYTLAADATIASDDAGVGGYLAGLLRSSTGYALPLRSGGQGSVSLLLSGADPSVGDQGYQLDVATSGVTIRARTAAGLFNGVQTLRQLLPPRVESASVQPGPWTVPGGRIVDHPRFAYRGTMLDVARHFHPVATVKRHIDRIALYKINYLHLHLSDDQGWRIVVDSWPRLATYGGSTQVGGGPGGYYTKAQYQEIVAYAAQRHITVVPEIDVPGHTNAALASYAELNCNGVAPPLYTGTGVGFSSLCATKEITYTFVADVIRELAELTPGPYLHIGGDEADATPDAQYATFMNRVQPMVAGRGKAVVGWHQIGAPAVRHSPGRVAQYWGTTTSDSLITNAVSKGAKVIMSPANKAYLDMKYTASTPLGQDWAALIEVKTAYEWNPGSHLSGVPASAVLGVEAPLWTETLVTEEHIEFMAFPRLPAIAELGWSPWSTHNWTAFRARLGAQAPRWAVMGIGFYRSPQVSWAATPPQGRHEAENAVISRGVVESNHAGYSGTGFVNYDNATGGYVEFTVTAATTGPATVRLRYANGTTANRRMNVAGTVHDFPGTGAWTTWQTKTLTLPLNAGSNVIRATATTSDGGPNLDYLEVAP
ncbi:family 20 glycosylhydrolase [Nonomuraea sp. NPDC059023]|uniref:family 20 glycosylhydrolase n=1 Tax=unclassified Nonomuraea TaxID=2593643 RepID=UPI0036B2DA08